MVISDLRFCICRPMLHQVALFEVTGFSPEAEESRANLVLADILYRFSLGVATRQTHTANQRSGAAPVAAAAAAPQPSGIAQQGQGQGQVPPTPDGAGYVRSASSDSLYSPSLYSDSANLSHETLDWERSRDFGRAVSSSASASASASSSGSGSGSGFGSSFAATPSVYPPTNPAGQSYAHPASASGGSNAYPSQMRGSPQQDRARSPMVGGVGAVARYNNSSQAKNEYLRPGGQVSEGHGEDVGVSFRSQQHSQTSRFNQQLPHHQQQQLHHQQQQYRSGQVMYKNQTQQSAALPHQGLPHGGYAINPNTRQPLVADMQAAKPLPSFSQWSGHTQPAPRQGFRVQEQGLPHQSALVGGQRFASSASMSMQRDAQHFASRGMAPMTASTMPGENDHAQDIASLQSCSYHNFMDGQHQQPQYRNAQAAPHMSNPANASKYSSLHSSSSNGYTTNSSMSASFSGKYGQQHSPAPIGSNTKNAGSENNLFHMMNAGSESSLFHTRNATGDFGIGNHFDFGGILGPPPSLQEPLHSRGGGNNFDADDLGVKGLGHVSYFDD